jgi:hypothetical protein
VGRATGSGQGNGKRNREVCHLECIEESGLDETMESSTESEQVDTPSLLAGLNYGYVLEWFQCRWLWVLEELGKPGHELGTELLESLGDGLQIGKELVEYYRVLYTPRRRGMGNPGSQMSQKCFWLALARSRTPWLAEDLRYWGSYWGSSSILLIPQAQGFPASWENGLIGLPI